MRYKVYKLDNSILGIFDTAAAALKAAITYQTATGSPAFVESCL